MFSESCSRHFLDGGDADPLGVASCMSGNLHCAPHSGHHIKFCTMRCTFRSLPDAISDLKNQVHLLEITQLYRERNHTLRPHRVSTVFQRQKKLRYCKQIR